MHVSVDSEPILARCPRQHALDDAASWVRVDNDLQNGLGREQDRQVVGGKQYRRRFGASRTEISVVAVMSERSDGGSLRGTPLNGKRRPWARAGQAVRWRKAVPPALRGLSSETPAVYVLLVPEAGLEPAHL